MDHYLADVVDLTDPGLNRIYNMTAAEALGRVLSGKPEAVREIEGSFALIARDGKMVRMARSMDRPMRYFLAKRHEGPALVVADRIDAIHAWLKANGMEGKEMIANAILNSKTPARTAIRCRRTVLMQNLLHLVVFCLAVVCAGLSK